MIFQDIELLIKWNQPYQNSIIDSKLIVYKQRFLKRPRVGAFLVDNESIKPLIVNYLFSINREHEYCWLLEKTNQQYMSIEIVEEAITWFINQIANKFKQNK